MSRDRDVVWADLVQFDTALADRVWEGDLSDPDAPAWYEHLGYLIVRARGPAEPDELADEPVVVPTMARVATGAGRGARVGANGGVTAQHRPSRVRTAGRIAAMKASAAATTLGMVGVAAATTGIVATVAATVVVPAISADRDTGSRDEVTTAVEVSEPDDDTDTDSSDRDVAGGAACAPEDDACGPVVVDVSTLPADPRAPADGATSDAGAVAPEGEAAATGAVPTASATPDTAPSDPTATTEPPPSGPVPTASAPAHGDPSPPGLPAPLVADDPVTEDAPGASEAAPGGPPIERPSPPRRAGSLRR